MKTNTFLKHKLIVIIAFYTLSGISACSKDDGPDEETPVDCKITAVTLTENNGTSQTVNYIYSGDRLKFINLPNESIEVFYTANNIMRISSQPNGWSTHSSIELNAAGLPIIQKDTTFNGQSVTQTIRHAFEYNSLGQLIKVDPDNALIPAQSFSWANGNLVKYQIGSTIYVLDYYTDQLNRDFTFFDFIFFTSWGVNPARSKNLLKSMTANNNQLTFHYEFDTEGNIKGYTAVMPGQVDPSIRNIQTVDCE